MTNGEIKNFVMLSVLFGVVGFFYVRRELKALREMQTDLAEKTVSLGVRG